MSIYEKWSNKFNLKKSINEYIDDTYITLDHLPMTKSVNFTMLVQLLEILNNNLKKVLENKEFLFKNLTYKVELIDFAKESKKENPFILIDKNGFGTNIIKITLERSKEEEMAIPILDRVTSEYTKIKIIEKDWEKYGEMFKDRDISKHEFLTVVKFVNLGIAGLSDEESFLLQVNLLKDSIKQWLKKEGVLDLEEKEWIKSISHCNFLQALNYNRTIMQYAIYSLILENDFTNQNLAYKSTIFRALKYCDQSTIYTLRDMDIRKLRTVVKILEKEKEDKYLFNGFLSQVSWKSGYIKDIVNSDYLDITDIILKSDSYDNGNIELKDLTPFAENGLKKISDKIKNKVKKISKQEKEDIVENKNEIVLEVDTNNFYKKLGLKNLVEFKYVYDQMIFEIFKQSNFLNNCSIVFNKNKDLENYIKKNVSKENSENYIRVKVSEENFGNIGSINKYINDLLKETSSSIENVFVDLLIDSVNKEKYIHPEDFSIKMTRVLNVCKKIIIQEKSIEILANLRKKELMSKLDMTNKKEDKSRLKI